MQNSACSSLHLLALLLCFSLAAVPAFASEPPPAVQDDDDDPWDDDPWPEDKDKDKEKKPSDTGTTTTTTTTTEPKASVSASGSISTLKSGGAFGLGFITGTINGLSMKIWPARAHGIVINLGAPFAANSLALSVSYHGHFRPIIVPNSPVSMHVQLGPRFRSRFAFATGVTVVELGGGAVTGLSVIVADIPAEIFFEVAPVVAGSIILVAGQDPTNSVAFSVDGGVGARFFF